MLVSETLSLNSLNSIQHQLYVAFRSKGKLSHEMAHVWSRLIVEAYKSAKKLKEQFPSARHWLPKREDLEQVTQEGVRGATNAMEWLNDDRVQTPQAVLSANFYTNQCIEYGFDTSQNAVIREAFYMTLVHTLPGRFPWIFKYFRLLEW